MKEQFASYEISLKLKELGFDEPCLAFYYPDSKELAPVMQNPMKGYFNNACLEETIHAPLWQQAIDWFREKYKWNIILEWNPIRKWSYTITESTPNKDLCLEMSYKSYEEAREQSILKAIEILELPKD